MPSKDELVALFRELTELTELAEGGPQSFRARAYENATVEIKAYGGDLGALSLAELQKLEGIGKSTAQKIREYYDTGTIAKLEELRAAYPPSFVELVRIPGLGPKTLQRLRSELGVESVDDLRAAIAAKKVRALKGLGAKTEEKLAAALERASVKKERRPLAAALPVAEELLAELRAMAEVSAAEVAGSVRRFRDTIADIDVVVASTEPAPVMERFVAMPWVRQVLGHGETKSAVVTEAGLQIDLRVVEPEQFGAALLYFTGSKAHNIALRQRALERGWTLNEYGLTVLGDGEIVASATEEDIYEALELAFVPPPLREGRGEIEAAATGELPAALELSQLRGDLHAHTELSGDGKSSVAEMAAAAAALGYEYLAITEHGEKLGRIGVSRRALEAHRRELEAAAAKHPGLTLLWGCELNIGADGSLDYDAELRNQLDFCVAAIHSHFDLSRAEQTARLIAAIDDPCVDVIGHLQGRMLGKRAGVDIDVDAVLEAAAARGVAIEINACLHRLDATDDVLRRAVELGCVFSLDTDAHHTGEFSRRRYGVAWALRGWVPPDRVINTWPLSRLRAWQRDRPARRGSPAHAG